MIRQLLKITCLALLFNLLDCFPGDLTVIGGSCTGADAWGVVKTMPVLYHRQAISGLKQQTRILRVVF